MLNRVLGGWNSGRHSNTCVHPYSQGELSERQDVGDCAECRSSTLPVDASAMQQCAVQEVCSMHVSNIGRGNCCSSALWLGKQRLTPPPPHTHTHTARTPTPPPNPTLVEHTNNVAVDPSCIPGLGWACPPPFHTPLLSLAAAPHQHCGNAVVVPPFGISGKLSGPQQQEEVLMQSSPTNCACYILYWASTVTTPPPPRQQHHPSNDAAQLHPPPHTHTHTPPKRRRLTRPSRTPGESAVLHLLLTNCQAHRSQR